MAQHSLKIEVQGLSCAGCAGRAERALQSVPGVSDVSVNFANGTARMFTDGTDLAQITDALEAANYPAREATVTLTVTGMTCASCVGRVERALSAQSGVLDASVNLTTETATVRYLPGATDPAQLARAATEAGYPARP